MRLSSRIFSGTGGAGAGINEIDATEAARMISEQNAIVVDVRTETEYAAGRIPDSLHVSLRQLPDRIDRLERYKDRPIVVNCRTGRRSASACAYLAQNGFEEVYNLKGGIRAWAHAKQSIVN
ncbi:MAG: rhodanese-like domain-containing protein [Thermoleophilia bacterium]